MPDPKVIKAVTDHLTRGELMRAEMRWEKLPELVLEAVRALKPDASPGLPLMEVYRTNYDVLEGEGEEYLVGVVLERMRRLSELPEELIHEGGDSMELVRLGCVDAVRMFVKNELHTAIKVLQERMRLIASVSVVDQIVERVLTSHLHKKEISDWRWGLVKPGMGLHDAGLAALAAHFGVMRRPAGTDARAWDWGVFYWLLMLAASLRSWQFGCGLRSERTYTTMWERRMHCLSLSVLVLSDGARYSEDYGGIMKSGSFWTSAINSWIRVVVAFLVALALQSERWDACAMGDDCVEDTGGVADPVVESVIREYRKLGVSIKEMEVGNEFEFCSYRFNLAAEKYQPARPWKLAAAFVYTWPCPGEYQSRRGDLSWELRHSPVKAEVMAVIDEVAIYMADRQREEASGGSRETSETESPV